MKNISTLISQFRINLPSKTFSNNIEKDSLPKWFILDAKSSDRLGEKMTIRPDEILICEYKKIAVGRFRFHTVLNILSAEHFSLKEYRISNKKEFKNILISFLGEIINQMKTRQLDKFDAYMVKPNIAMILQRLGAKITKYPNIDMYRVIWNLEDMQDVYSQKLIRQLRVQ